VRDGDLLSVDGRHGKPGSPPGDLSIRVEVRQHALLKLDKDGTVLCDLPVDGFTWIANRSVQVPTLGGLHDSTATHQLAVSAGPSAERRVRGDQRTPISPIFPERITRTSTCSIS
jgi:molecular chaperone DnaJ